MKAWYGVARGDGNMGVSTMFADFYVFTDDPWTLAERAAQNDIKPEYHDEIDYDGDETQVTASTYDADMEYCDYVLEVTLEDDRAWLKKRYADKAAPFYRSIKQCFGG